MICSFKKKNLFCTLTSMSGSALHCGITTVAMRDVALPQITNIFHWFWGKWGEAVFRNVTELRGRGINPLNSSTKTTAVSAGKPGGPLPEGRALRRQRREWGPLSSTSLVMMELCVYLFYLHRQCLYVGRHTKGMNGFIGRSSPPTSLPDTLPAATATVPGPYSPLRRRLMRAQAHQLL